MSGVINKCLLERMNTVGMKHIKNIIALHKLERPVPLINFILFTATRMRVGMFQIRG